MIFLCFWECLDDLTSDLWYNQNFHNLTENWGLEFLIAKYKPLYWNITFKVSIK